MICLLSHRQCSNPVLRDSQPLQLLCCLPPGTLTTEGKWKWGNKGPAHCPGSWLHPQTLRFTKGSVRWVMMDHLQVYCLLISSALARRHLRESNQFGTPLLMVLSCSDPAAVKIRGLWGAGLSGIRSFFALLGCTVLLGCTQMVLQGNLSAREKRKDCCLRSE